MCIVRDLQCCGMNNELDADQAKDWDGVEQAMEDLMDELKAAKEAVSGKVFSFHLSTLAEENELVGADHSGEFLFADTTSSSRLQR